MEPPQPLSAVAVRVAVEAAIGGDGRELGEILEEYRPRLERMVAFRIDVRLRGRVEPSDVVQEAFADALERLPDWFERREMNFFLWVRLETGQKLSQLHRRHLDVEGRDARREVPFELRMPGASSFAMASALLDASNTPSRAAMKNEEGLQLRDAIEKMKEIDREVIALRHFEMLSNKEVAHVLGLTEPGATLRYVRAITRLRGVLDQLGIAPETLG